MLYEKDSFGKIPLHYAAGRNSSLAAHYLLAYMKKNFDTNSGVASSLDMQDNIGKSPLHYSVELALVSPESTSTLRTLLIYGSDRNVKDHYN